jgi:L-rhamnose-H+ transport protein
MNPIAANPILGVLLLAVGASMGATCFAPQKKVRGWSWQSYWLVMAAFAWFVLPIVGAWATIQPFGLEVLREAPLLGAWAMIRHLGEVLRAAPRSAMVNSFLLGAVYGVGAIAFGQAIGAIGFSLTYAIAIGLSAVLGTLVPPLVVGTLGPMLQRAGAGWVIAGLVAGVAGIALTGRAGWLKDRDLAASGSTGEFRLMRGLILSLAAGVLSAFYGFALAAGEPIADVAFARGAGIYRGNVTYIFANTGTFLTTVVYCAWLHVRNGTWSEMTRPAAMAGPPASLGLNYLMAFITGLFWYGQFFFYNLGNVRMGAYKFTSWAIHMILTVLVSNLVGVAFREWRGCRGRTHRAIAIALFVLVAAVLLLTYGNHLGDALAGP